MLKDDLERIISLNCPRFPIGLGLSTTIERKEISNLAQAIIDKLEIDWDIVWNCIWRWREKFGYTKQMKIYDLAKAISEAKPIKLKESDK